MRRITADNALREKLVAGTIVIARCEGKYDLVLPEIAERIRERDERAVVKLNAEEAKPAADDPYKDYRRARRPDVVMRGTGLGHLRRSSAERRGIDQSSTLRARS